MFAFAFRNVSVADITLIIMILFWYAPFHFQFSISESSRLAVRLAPEEISNSLTGFEHNGVTCIGMKTDIPVITELKYLQSLFSAFSPE